MEGNPTPPPVAYAAYPRVGDTNAYGTSEKLIDLFKGYHGMSYTFLWAVVGQVAFFVGIAMLSSKDVEIYGALVMLIGIVGIIFSIYTSVKACVRIGNASNMSRGVSILLGVIAPFVGIIMIVIVQYIALEEIKRYGVKTGVFGGLKKKAVVECIEWLQQHEGKPVTGLATSQ